MATDRGEGYSYKPYDPGSKNTLVHKESRNSLVSPKPDIDYGRFAEMAQGLGLVKLPETIFGRRTQWRGYFNSSLQVPNFQTEPSQLAVGLALRFADPDEGDPAKPNYPNALVVVAGKDSKLDVGEFQQDVVVLADGWVRINDRDRVTRSLMTTAGGAIGGVAGWAISRRGNRAGMLEAGLSAVAGGVVGRALANRLIEVADERVAGRVPAIKKYLADSAASAEIVELKTHFENVKKDEEIYGALKDQGIGGDLLTPRRYLEAQMIFWSYSMDALIQKGLPVGADFTTQGEVEAYRVIFEDMKSRNLVFNDDEIQGRINEIARREARAPVPR